MNQLLGVFVALGLVFALQSSASAEGPAQAYKVDGTTLSPVAPLAADSPLDKAGTFKVKCLSLCDKLTVAGVTADGTKIPLVTGEFATAKDFDIELADYSSIEISYNGQPLKTLNTTAAPKVPTAGSGGTPDPAAGSGGIPDPPASGFSCPTGKLPKRTIYVDVRGNVLDANVDEFREDHNLTVWLQAPATALEELHIKRTSEFRNATVLRIVGNPDDVLSKKLQSGAQPLCKRVILHNFEPGRGEFQVVSRKSDGQETVHAEFELIVNPKNIGMFTFGLISTKLVQQTFSLRTQGADQILDVDPAGSRELRYALMYTAFVPLHSWGVVGEQKWDSIAGFSIGTLVDGPVDNFLFGVNLGPMNGLSIVMGKHLGKVTRLRSGFSEGDTFEGEEEDLPTQSRWESDTFIGVNVDILIASKLVFSFFNPGR